MILLSLRARHVTECCECTCSNVELEFACLSGLVSCLGSSIGRVSALWV